MILPFFGVIGIGVVVTFEESSPPPAIQKSNTTEISKSTAMPNVILGRLFKNSKQFRKHSPIFVGVKTNFLNFYID